MAKTVLSPSDRAAKVGAEDWVPLSAYQQTIAAATIGGLHAKFPMVLRGIRARVGVCGTAGATTVQLHRNGSAIAGCEVTIDNADPDGTVRQAAPTAGEVAVAADEALEIVVSAAPTAGTDLSVDVLLARSY